MHAKSGELCGLLLEMLGVFDIEHVQKGVLRICTRYELIENVPKVHQIADILKMITTR